METKIIIYSLIREALFNHDNTKLSEISEEQWEDVYAELKEQTISCIPAEWIFKNIVLPETLRLKWEKHYMWQVAFYYQLLYAQDELVSLMSTNQIPMVILKGTAAAINYPQPSVRMMGDIDFLVPKAQFEKAYRLMLDNGYQLIHEEDSVEHHIALQKNKFIYELHKEPNGIPDAEEGEYIRNLIEEGVKTPDRVRLDEYEIPILPSLQNGVVLFLHIVVHLKNGLGLRQIIDWMLYANRELHDEHWYHVIQPALQNTKYEKLAKVVTRMCQIYLGLDQKKITWCRDVDDSLCEKLMNYIMEQGNFGRKVKEEDQGIKIIEKVRNPIQLFNALQKRGEINWKALQKYPKLRPFSWIYTSCMYMKKASRQDVLIRKMMSDVKAGKELRNLYEELGI